MFCATRTAVRRWFLAALAYFFLSVLLGVYMGASGNHGWATIHSHLGMLGWGSMGLTGVLYRAFPGAASTRLAFWHFVLYQVSVPSMLVAVALLLSGSTVAEPIAGIASVAILVAVVLFGGAILSSRRTA